MAFSSLAFLFTPRSLHKFGRELTDSAMVNGHVNDLAAAEFCRRRCLDSGNGICGKVEMQA